MKLLDRLRERELIRTNPLGAETTFAIGQLVEVDGESFRVSRHKSYPTLPWATIVVYGVPFTEGGSSDG